MTDSIIYLLAGRNHGIPDNLAPDNLDFLIPSRDRDWVNLHTTLNLGHRSTGYYLVMALSVLQAHPHILDRIPGSELSIRAQDMRRYTSRIAGGYFSKMGTKVGGTTRYTGSFPIPFKYTMKLYKDGAMRVVTDTGKKFDKRFNVWNIKGNTFIDGDWAGKFPLEGPLVLGKTLHDGQELVLEYIPLGLSYGSLVEHLESKMKLIEYLYRRKWVQDYTISDSPAEKLAVVYAAMICEKP
jgi:hypothetical protein